MKKSWKESTFVEKIAAILSIIICLAVVVLAILQIFKVWSTSIDLLVPLLGVNMLLQAFIQWKVNRWVSIFSLCVSGFIFICAIVIFFVR